MTGKSKYGFYSLKRLRRFSAKGAIYAKVEIDKNRTLHVFNTHLQTSYERDPSMKDSSVLVRLNQLQALKDFIDECTRDKKPEEPILLMGDFHVNA